jgi:hypothetical protein
VINKKDLYSIWSLLCLFLLMWAVVAGVVHWLIISVTKAFESM